MNKYTFALILLLLSLNLSADQVINPNITNYWPDNRYEVHGDGTVTDTVTGLMWMQCNLGQEHSVGTCSGGSARYDWGAALEIADGYSFASYSDWRLPNIKELSSLAARDRYNPAINSTIFPNTPSYYYWSSSPSSMDRDEDTWWLDFDDGSIVYFPYDYSYHVRLVRSDQ